MKKTDIILKALAGRGTNQIDVTLAEIAELYNVVQMLKKELEDKIEWYRLLTRDEEAKI